MLVVMQLMEVAFPNNLDVTLLAELVVLASPTLTALQLLPTVEVMDCVMTAALMETNVVLVLMVLLVPPLLTPTVILKLVFA
jgi:hypothetical protein